MMSSNDEFECSNVDRAIESALDFLTTRERSVLLKRSSHSPPRRFVTGPRPIPRSSNMASDSVSWRHNNYRLQAGYF